ncbi:septation protein SepH [Actinomadura sp. 7K507]|uniref:septation protein SepH n=1 Tax=Actinomadura sp. 7K507 TaxID=2530365 RepID=UPI001FB64C55|nr:septation protein SepH [Actinomadura sp. 7K507]
MQELRLVAVSEDGTYLVLATAGRGTRFTLPVDDRLRAAVRGHFSRLGQFEIEVESPLRPKEIQARIRSGETAEEIAESAGIPVERVRWFEGPVLQEREYMAQQAQRVAVRRPGESSPGPPLGETVEERLGRGGVDLDEVEWDAWKCEDNTWRLRLSFFDNGRPHAAEWTFDPRRRYVSPLDEIAARLTAVEWDDDALSDTVTPLVPRRPAMKVVSSDRDPAAGLPAAPREYAADARPAFREAAEATPLREASRPQAPRPDEDLEPLRTAGERQSAQLTESRGGESALPRDTGTAQEAPRPRAFQDQEPDEHATGRPPGRRPAQLREAVAEREARDSRDHETVQPRDTGSGREEDRSRDSAHERENVQLRETGPGREEHRPGDTTRERETAQARETDAGREERQPRDTTHERETAQTRETDAGRDERQARDTTHERQTAQTRETDAGREERQARETAQAREAGLGREERRPGDRVHERDAGQVRETGAGREEREAGDSVHEREADRSGETTGAQEVAQAGEASEGGETTGSRDGRERLGEAGETDEREVSRDREAARSRDGRETLGTVGEPETERRDEAPEQAAGSNGMADAQEPVQVGDTSEDREAAHVHEVTRQDETVAEPEAAQSGDAGRGREAGSDGEREAARFADTPARRAARLREIEDREEEERARAAEESPVGEDAEEPEAGSPRREDASEAEPAEDERLAREKKPAAQRPAQRQPSRTPAKKKPAARPTMPAAGQDKPAAGSPPPAAAAAANAEPAAAQRPARRRKPKGKRASVPSWDEIMFGARRPE